jgi:hypothetical protein
MKENTIQSDKDKFPKFLEKESFGNLANPLKSTKSENFAEFDK